MFGQFASRAPVGALLIGLAAAGCHSSPAVGSHTSALTGSGSLVISKLYGGGGNSGAPLTYDFVELMNRSALPVDVTGWSLQYASATTATWHAVTLGSVTIPSGSYYLVQLATSSATVGAPLPATADLSSTTINLSATNGKLALVSTSTLLTCGATAGSCAGAAGLVDLVGYGTATDFEGAVAPAGTNTGVLVRAGEGCTDADNNSTDFTLLSITAPTDVTLHNQVSPVFTFACVPPADMAQPADMTTPPDLIGADLAQPADLATPPDLIGADLSTPPDLTVPADLTPPPDLTAPPADLASDPSGAGMVVISQIYGSGGNTGATFTNDYIELFNRGKTPVSISNWSVQYGSAANAFSQKAILPSGATIGAGQYYLVQVAGGAVGTALPTADFVLAGTSFNISASNGKIALVDNSTLLTCGTAAARCSSPSISDLVGFGTAADYEGSAAAPTPGGATKALFRAGAGCVDTQDNAADIAPGDAAPRNSATAAVDCGAVVIDMSVPADLSAGSGGGGGGSAGGNGSAGGSGSAGGGGSSGSAGGGTHSSGGGGGCSVSGHAPTDAGAPAVLLLAAMGFWIRRRARVRLG